MIRLRSLRARVMLGAILWTLGLFAVITILLTLSVHARESVRVIHAHSRLSAVVAIACMAAGLVLVLTARGSWHEKVQGIDGGADDYVAKPFSMEEVLARLRALIRRASGQVTPELRCGALTLDPRVARVTVNGAAVKLTSHEFRVLSYLMHQHGRVVSQAELTEHIYAQSADRDSNTVEVFIARLRRKLGGSHIETLRGLGYRMSEDDPR